jgi:hypothetical protein
MGAAAGGLNALGKKSECATSLKHRHHFSDTNEIGLIQIF